MISIKKLYLEVKTIKV